MNRNGTSWFQTIRVMCNDGTFIIVITSTYNMYQPQRKKNSQNKKDGYEDDDVVERVLTN